MGSLAVTDLSERQALAELRARAGFPDKTQTRELLKVALAAATFWPPRYVKSIFGPPLSWPPPHRELSELTILDPWRAVRTLRFLTDVSVPAFDHQAPALARTLLPRLLNGLFWRPTTFFEQPDPYGRFCGPPGEQWFYINGVATNHDVALLNAALLGELFHRPISVIQNATHSLAFDLTECAIGKEFRTEPDLEDHHTFTEPALEATLAILESLNRPDVDRVVVIAHSQGTIIAANVLRAIAKALGAVEGKAGPRRAIPRTVRQVAKELTSRLEQRLGLRSRLADSLAVFVDRPGRTIARLRKLELYTFANCADKMRWVAGRGGSRLPYIENFANEHDLVARLGVLSPYRDRPELIDIDGPLYLRTGEGSWGHLLNEHHLFAIQDHLESPGEVDNPYPLEQRAGPGRPRGRKLPRLYGYFLGASPD